MEPPKSLEDIDRIIEQREHQKERPPTKTPFIYMVLVTLAFILFAFLFNSFFFKAKSASQIISWFLALFIFILLYFAVSIFLLTSNLLSDKDKSTLRKLLFVFSPQPGWGSSVEDFKKDPKIWDVFIIVGAIGLVGILSFLLLSFLLRVIRF